MNRKGAIQVLGIVLLGVFLLFIFTSGAAIFTGRNLAVSGAMDPCEFDAIPGQTQVLEDFSRSDIAVNNEKSPPPKGWVVAGDGGIYWDHTVGKLDCGQGCANLVNFGFDNRLNRLGSYSAFSSDDSRGWDVYTTKVNLNAGKTRLDFNDYRFNQPDRPDLVRIVDSWYIAEADSEGRPTANRQTILKIGPDGDAGKKGGFSADKIFICVDAERKTATVLSDAKTGEDVLAFTSLVKLGNGKWILGFHTSVGGSPKFLSAFSAQEIKIYNNSAPSLAAATFTGSAELHSEMSLDQIDYTAYSPEQATLITTKPQLPAVEESAQPIQPQEKGFFGKLAEIILQIFSPLTKLFSK